MTIERDNPNGFGYIRNDYASVKDITDHIVECEDFKMMYCCREHRHLSELLYCSCGFHWNFSHAFLMTKEGDTIRRFMEAVSRGDFGANCEDLLLRVRKEKCKKMKEKIISRRSSLEPYLNKIEEKNKVDRLKKFHSPILSLEIED